MRDQLADPGQVALAYRVHHEVVRGVQDQPVRARRGLQGFQPGVHVLGGELGLEAFEAAGPEGFHRDKKLSGPLPAGCG